MKKKQKERYDFGENEYTDRARIKPEKWALIKLEAKPKGYKSAAAYLDAIIDEHFTPNLFNKKKK